MNTGLQDAYNLAWKLALVFSGRADAALLDTYEAERLPVAHRLLATTDRAFRVVVADNWLAATLRTWIVPNVAALAMTRKSARTAAFRALSQIDISYRRSPLSRASESVDGNAPHAGDRFPWLRLRFNKDGPSEDLFEKLDDTRFNLLVIGQPPPSLELLGLGELLDVHAIPSDRDNDVELARASIKGPAYYLLRPDGHIGLGGARFDEAALRGWFASAAVHVGIRESDRAPSGGNQLAM
jgi:hypothetical protein